MIERHEIVEADARDTGATRQDFAKALRDARNAKQLTQAELAARAGVNRYLITRLEGGSQDAGMDLARALADVLDAPDLTDRATIPMRSGTRFRLPAQRREVLDTLLSARVVDRLVVVVADEIDILGLLQAARVNLPPTVSIVFPTRERQNELRGTNRPGGLGPSWDVQTQINRIFEASSGQLSGDGLGADIKLYESDDVRQSFVLVGSSEGVFCVSWPILPNLAGPEADSLPSIVSQDSGFIQHIEDHVRQLLVGRTPLTHLKAIVINGKDDRGQRIHDLSMFFELGETTELDVLHGNHDLNGGFAVSLVLIHGVVQQAQRPLGRRLILPFDDKTEKHELFATTASYADFLGEDYELSRSTLDAEAAIDHLTQSHPADPGAVGAEIFARAARRGIIDEFGIKVPLDRFEEIALPEGLWIVLKGPASVPVIPRLFQLNLSPSATPSDAASEDHQDSLDWRSALRMAFQRKPAVRAVGIADLLVRDDEFNDFIQRARVFEDGWLIRKLADLGVAEK